LPQIIKIKRKIKWKNHEQNSIVEIEKPFKIKINEQNENIINVEIEKNQCITTLSKKIIISIQQYKTKKC
jgi:hypothetical protein